MRDAENDLEIIRNARRGKNGSKRVQTDIEPADFYAYMIEHKYIFAPTGEIWPASSVDARLSVIGNIKASAWIDQNRPVEQMTWAPGMPVVIDNRLIAHGGWFERKGCCVFNRPPLVKPIAGNASTWLHHIDRLYGAEHAAHIVRWCAHRVQHPANKINHALVLGGKQGIGKDTLLEPVKYAVGAWNFNEVSPQQVLGRFNGFLKSVILRVSEARDLGEFDRFAFYDHMKGITAAPPDVLRIDEKHRNEYVIPNVCGVIITTNHKSDGIFLPADDRRHFVAWSDLDKSDFTPAYWNGLWEWYGRGGLDVVAHYLANLDLTGFNPKAPPPQTNAFFEIVNASRSPTTAELSDALDRIAEQSEAYPPDDRHLTDKRQFWPYAVTVADIVAATTSTSFADFLQDRRNARTIGHRFEECGYVPVRNSGAEDGLWAIRKRRQVIYGRAVDGEGGRIAAVTDYMKANQ